MATLVLVSSVVVILLALFVVMKASGREKRKARGPLRVKSMEDIRKARRGQAPDEQSQPEAPPRGRFKFTSRTGE